MNEARVAELEEAVVVEPVVEAAVETPVEAAVEAVAVTEDAVLDGNDSDGY